MSSYIDDLLWVSVDTETTGINPYEHELIEIGATLFSLKAIEKKFQTLIKIQKKQDPQAQQIHKITNEEIEKKGVPVKEALEGFVDFIQDYPLIFHNAPFDLSFLVLAFSEQKIELPKNTYYDNLFISRTHFPDRKSHSLHYLRKLLDIDTGEAHRALVDAEATAHVFMISLSQKHEQLQSKKTYNKFLRYHRKIHKFKVNLPKNFARIEKYFERYIKTKKVLHIKYKDQNAEKKDIKCSVKEVMVFNQNVFIKASAFLKEDTEGDILIPLKYAKIYDPDRGILGLEDIK